MVSNQQFRLKWNNHRNTVLQEFETLLHNNSFVDCTIGADGKYLKAHKIVLSACSPYLQNVFSEHFDKHPVILLKDVSFKELKCMIDYMYCGEVNISECELPSFLRTAQSLKIKGLAEDINDYDSASDNEQQDSITENGRTVEPNVEIHDDEGPPAKKTAPSLIYSNFAGRKRKSPNNAVSSATKSSNSNEKVPPSVPLSSKLTGGNVPSCADTENSDSKVASGKENNNLHKEEPDDDKKIVTRHNHQDNVKNKPEVKEEPVDADDDNSSYEFGNNACEDSDPLNEDSESNCATPGKNFNEVSIASVSSCNEGEANGYLLSQFQNFGEISVVARQSVNNFSKSSMYAIKSGCYGPFYCPQCNNHYVWKKNLIRHLKLECGKEPRFQCALCPYKTKHKSSLHIHTRNRHF